MAEKMNYKMQDSVAEMRAGMFNVSVLLWRDSRKLNVSMHDASLSLGRCTFGWAELLLNHAGRCHRWPRLSFDITQTREGLGSNGEDQQERDGYKSGDDVSAAASDPNVFREGRIATGPTCENSARGGYVGAQAFNQDDGPERAISPKTGYVPAEDTRQVPSPVIIFTAARTAHNRRWGEYRTHYVGLAPDLGSSQVAVTLSKPRISHPRAIAGHYRISNPSEMTNSRSRGSVGRSSTEHCDNKTSRLSHGRGKSTEVSVGPQKRRP